MNTLTVPTKLFKGRRFHQEVILLCVCWQVTYKLSYRDLAEMMSDRGISLVHSTILRWAQRYIPEFEKQWRKTHRIIGGSWYIDETYYRVKRKWTYLHRTEVSFGSRAAVVV